MVKNYLKRNLMLAAAAAAVISAGAQTYSDVTLKYMKNPAFFPGWQGAITDVVNGTGEVYNGAFNIYQTINDAPAGEYTLTVNAFYRCGNNEFSQQNMEGEANHNAFIYINDEKQIVEGLFDGGRAIAPNSTGEAHDSFAAGDYLNTVKYTHAGGDLVIGISNTGGYSDEWTCFSNFKLTGPDGEITLANADFTEGLGINNEKGNESVDYWDIMNASGAKKTPDVNKGGGVYRKTNASPYNFGQQIELPAGKYRFSALTFLRYGGAGDYDSQVISCKSAWGMLDVPNSPKQFYEKDLYKEDDTQNNAYLYVSFNATKPANLDWEDNFGELNKATDKRERLKGTWELNEGDYAKMPENETRGTAEKEEIVPTYEQTNQFGTMVPGWCDSGMERESSYVFVNESEKYRQYVEFEVTETAKVWVGLGKNENAPAQYWNPFADFKLEVLVEGAGVDDVVADQADEAAPVEYYNLQGVRVENPAHGLYIVKQGTKVTKQLIR